MQHSFSLHEIIIRWRQGHASLSIANILTLYWCERNNFQGWHQVL